MRLILFVGTGSFIGGICRYLLSTLIQSKSVSEFPYGTLAVNLTGCFLIGILYGVFEKIPVTTEWRLLFVTGVLGGFTTFSAFSGETFNMLRSGHIASGFIYVAASVLIGIMLTFSGAWIIKVSM
ncbi:MAG TPA: fluoride efflux transporter CrcB [Flavitalea sp.]|nr:fluoride efflux transporter CrcB [Flavitalea sp.]